MPASPYQGDGSAQESEQFTLASLMHCFSNPQLDSELERFRVTFEARFGETDLTKRYTSTWPQDQQEWLLTNHPRRYWAGLPAFVQAFIKGKMRTAHKNGKLDDMPKEMLELFLSNQMDIGGGERSR